MRARNGKSSASSICLMYVVSHRGSSTFCPLSCDLDSFVPCRKCPSALSNWTRATPRFSREEPSTHTSPLNHDTTVLLPADLSPVDRNGFVSSSVDHPLGIGRDFNPGVGQTRFHFLTS